MRLAGTKIAGYQQSLDLTVAVYRRRQLIEALCERGFSRRLVGA